MPALNQTTTIAVLCSVPSIPLFLEDAGLLPSLVRRSHIGHYAPAVSLTWRLPESSMILGINLKSLAKLEFAQAR